VATAGKVTVDGHPVLKAGSPVGAAARVSVQAEVPKYVCRAGNKLEAVLAAFGISLVGKAALDAGLSTGGFTDCLLQHGAVSVVGVDVGYGQVAERVRTDARVRVMERTNVRNLRLADIGGVPVDVVTLDLSFISGKQACMSPVALPGRCMAWDCSGNAQGLLLASAGLRLPWDYCCSAVPDQRTLAGLPVVGEAEQPVRSLTPSHPPALPAVLKVQEAVCSVLRPNGELIVLIKPQFEAGKQQVGFWRRKQQRGGPAAAARVEPELELELELLPLRL
jgi:predicted rRNA methylase YqxC with S4 and FtsJ domains